MGNPPNTTSLRKDSRASINILTPILSFPMVLLGLEDFAKVSQSMVLVVELDIFEIPN